MRSKFYLFFAAILAVSVVSSIPKAQAADPAVKCEASKLKESAKYGNCRLKAESKGVKKGQSADFTKCETKFTEKFNKAETKAGPGVCPSEADEPAINGRITRHANDIATLLSGGTVAGFPATGQTTVFGPGSDGDVQAGAALSYTDDGDGTITDNNTGLVWEKKDDSGGVHDKDNLYSWSTGTNNMDGTMVTTLLNTLNDVAGGGANCFAGHCDWRIPNVKELQSIVDYGVFTPSIDPAFHQAATCTGCTDVTLASCSCAERSRHWSSTTIAAGPGVAWFVNFDSGGVNSTGKTSNNEHARAVRGPL